MPIQIGQKPGHDFTEPLGLLSDCHRRIERFLNVLRKVAADARGGELNDEQCHALSTALEYFRSAAPKHTADEEESLFPRLRGAAAEEAGAVLDSLEQDHQRADSLHREADDLGIRWLRAGMLPAELAERFRAVTDELASIYGEHIVVEDTRLFPLAARVLGAADQREIGFEMAARRKE